MNPIRAFGPGKGRIFMAGFIKIDSERCKGCGLCVPVCPVKSISISPISNQKGLFPAQFDNKGCTGCALCAIMCPDAAIEVYRESTGTVKSDKQSRRKFAEEKS